MAEEKISKLEQAIENCLLPKLACTFEAKNNHAEYDVRKNNLNENVTLLRELLGDTNLKEHANSASDVLSSLLIMYTELQTEGTWNTKQSLETARFLNSDFERIHEITLEEKLHSKLTLKDFKQYPSLIEVYCLFIQHLNEYNVQVSSLKTLPISLILIDDYEAKLKIKGLSSCKMILQFLTAEDITSGNYHEVIYLSLVNSLREKKLEITELALECLFNFQMHLPVTAKKTKMDHLFSKLLDELFMESNFSRKVIFLKFIEKIIPIHGTNCVKRKKKFIKIIIENIGLCVNESIREDLLQQCLECLEVWIKYCWAAWYYKTDLQLISELLKLLYVLDIAESELVDKVQNLIVALICSCGEDDQSKIILSIKNFNNCKRDFSERLEVILSYFQLCNK